VAGVSTTAAQPASPARLLEYVAMRFGDLDEYTPLSVMLRQSASVAVYGGALSLYKLAGEK